MICGECKALEKPYRVRCRQILAADAASVIELLMRGFPARTRGYWDRAMQRLAQRPTPASYPRFGYLLETDRAVVGVILGIYSARYENGKARVRCNYSSWYVDPWYRSYGSFLITAATRQKEVTYTNLTPAHNTWPIIEAQGFACYCFGQFIAVPSLNTRVANTSVHRFDAHHDYGPTLRDDERDILISHVACGCLAYIVTESDEAHPFVFLPYRIASGIVPTLLLVYCRDTTDFVRFAGPIGRALLRNGNVLVNIDAVGPLPGLVGKYFPHRGWRRYFKGPDRPRLGDLTYSELVLFGP
jgi:hypothetical protein